MLLLTNAAEEGGDAPFETSVQKKVGVDDGDAVRSPDLERKGRLVAGGDLRPAGETAALEARDREVVVALLEGYEFLAVALNGVIPVEKHILFVFHDLSPYLSGVFLMISAILSQLGMTQERMNFSEYSVMEVRTSY